MRGQDCIQALLAGAFHRCSQRVPCIPAEAPHARWNSAEPPQPVEVEGEAHYEVEALLKHRERRGGRQYLVRWTGYGPEHDEWVHERELEHAKDMLKNCKEANGLH